MGSRVPPCAESDAESGVESDPESEVVSDVVSEDSDGGPMAAPDTGVPDVSPLPIIVFGVVPVWVLIVWVLLSPLLVDVLFTFFLGGLVPLTPFLTPDRPSVPDGRLPEAVDRLGSGAGALAPELIRFPLVAS